MNKVVLITGCSSGFGLSFVEILGKEHIVYATTRSSSDKTQLNRVINDGKTIYHDVLDVTDDHSIDTVINTIIRKEGRLDVLINNAGYAQVGFFEDLTEDEVRKQMEINFFGVQKVTRKALPLLRKTPGSKIIMISSIAGLASHPLLSAYNASKHALEGFSESLRLELSPFDTSVVLVEPGMFKTNIFLKEDMLGENMINPSSAYAHFNDFILTKKESIVKKVSADPLDVARLVKKIVEAKKPALRYVIGKDARFRLFLKRVLPFSFYEWVYLRMVGRVWNSSRQ